MKKVRYTDEQIAFDLKQAERRTPVQEVIRRYAKKAMLYLTLCKPCLGPTYPIHGIGFAFSSNDCKKNTAVENNSSCVRPTPSVGYEA